MPAALLTLESSRLPSCSDVLTADDERTIQKIARDLNDPTLPDEQRLVRLRLLEEIAGRYACDTRFAD